MPNQKLLLLAKLSTVIILYYYIIVSDQTPCPSDWNIGVAFRSCYLIPHIALPWQSARDYCRNTVGGELASITNDSEYQYVRSM
jgi:hypothetical protein